MSSSYYALGYENPAEQEEYVAGALAWLESFCLAGQHKLSQEEAASWMQRLGTYHRNRLSKLSNYTGKMNNDVFKFLDELRIEIPSPPVLEEPTVMAGEKLPKQVMAHVERMFSDTLSKEDKDAAEVEFITRMRVEFPRIDWVCTRSANRGK